MTEKTIYQYHVTEKTKQVKATIDLWQKSILRAVNKP